MSVTGRVLRPAPAIVPVERRNFGDTTARRFETVSFNPIKETKDLPFPFLNAGEAHRLRIKITGFSLIEPAAHPGFTGEEFGASFAFTWPEGVTGANPRNPLVFVRKTGGVIGAVFSLPLNECRPTSKDGDVLKIAFRKLEGSATATAVHLFLEVLEEWTEAEAPTLTPTLGRHAVGVARPKLKVAGCNGGVATFPPIKKAGAG